MKKLLITGASGFVGSHIVEWLHGNKEYEVFGTVFGGGNEFLGQYLDQSHMFPLNLLQRSAVFEAIKKVQPDEIIHLAALSSPLQSYEDAHTTLINNSVGQGNLLDALLEHAPNSTTLVIGSAEEYGKVAESELPISEENELRPMSPYAVSKITQDFMGLQYYLMHSLKIVRLRPFNHIGERQSPAFALPAFAKQVALIELGRQEPILFTGDLSATRDLTDVKDMVRAYLLALEQGVPGEVYNIGTGTSVTMQQLVELLLSYSKIKIAVKQRPDTKPSPVARLVADPSTFMTLTGWSPTITLEQTVLRVLDYWRESTRQETN